jgi:hypothetical protein
MTVPGAKLSVTNHSGLLLVYSDAESPTALLVSQFPSAAMFPAIFIVSPYVVVTVSSKVTATEVAAAHELVVVVVLLVLVVLVDVVVVVDALLVELVDPDMLCQSLLGVYAG